MKTEVICTEVHELLEPIFIHLCITNLSVNRPADFPVVGSLTE